MNEEFEFVVLSPNLGNPVIINTKRKKSERLSFKSLIYVNSDKDLKRTFRNSIPFRLIPLIISNSNKKRSKKTNTIISSIARGNPIKLITSDIESFKPNYENFIDINTYVNKDIISRNVYQIEFQFRLNKKLIKYLKKKSFLMFDLIYNNKQGQETINYHSLVVSKSKWEDFVFVQATDLHVADRNDNIYELVKNWLSAFRNKAFADFAKFSLESLSFLSKTFWNLFDNKSKKRTKKDIITRFEPLRRRLINPNNNLRKFIRIMNKKVLRNELDFIIFTGDLIDYSTLSHLSADFKKFSNFEYLNTNWKVLKDILLNKPQKKRRGMVRGEEILCPIFTIPGNHDFRPYHYDLRWGNLYKKIGLNANEAIALNDALAAHPIGSITRNFLALKGFLLEFNFKLNYSFNLGKYKFILLNTGPDSFKNLRDFISGHPSATGISSKQVKYLEYLINERAKDERIFLFLHGPPINPQRNLSIFDRFILNKLTHKQFRRINPSAESRRNNGQKPRLDLEFNLKYGTISTNWEKLINFCKDYCFITFCGHTHEFKEFRLKNPDNTKSRVLKAPPFILKKLENPAAVYYDIYSETDEDPESILKKAPYVVQTPALGLGGYHHPKLAGAYREVRIKKGEVESFKVHFIKKR